MPNRYNPYLIVVEAGVSITIVHQYAFIFQYKDSFLGVELLLPAEVDEQLG